MISLNFSKALSLPDVSAIFATVFVVVQLLLQTSATRSQARAYLHITVTKGMKDNREMVFLHIFNSGKTSAKEVQLSFEPNAEWADLNHGLKPGFADDKTSLTLQPSEELVYLLGPVAGLPKYDSTGFEVTVTYRPLKWSRLVREKTQLVFSTKRFLVGRIIH